MLLLIIVNNDNANNTNSDYWFFNDYDNGNDYNGGWNEL